MEDEKIIALYWERNEQALEETAKKYNPYCLSIAKGLLGNLEDAWECVNDTYRAAWDSIPPNRPRILSSYLAKLTRRICMKVWRSRDTRKRGCGELPLSLEELGQCIPDGKQIDDELNARELGAAIDCFLQELPEMERRVFVRRYFHGISIGELCAQFGFSKSKTESMLHRTRKKLRDYLEQEGYWV